MFRNCFFILFLALNIFNFNTANAKDKNADLTKVLKNISPALSNAGTIDYKTGCATCAMAASNSSKQTSAILYSKDNNQKIELSVISEDQANSAFSELAERKDIPYGYAMDGCYARAHKMDRILANQGIIAGKAFMEGEFYVDTEFGEVGWSYNVAPLVMVKKGSEVIPYVIDPSLFSKPVPQTEWKAKLLTKSKAKLTREYYTNRFSYDPSDREAKYTDYVDETLDDMEQTNRNFSRMLAMYMFNKSKQQ